jgi:hypothetical protein
MPYRKDYARTNGHFTLRTSSHPACSLEFAVTDFHLFGKIKEGLGPRQALSSNKVLNAVNGIRRMIAQPELKNAFDHRVRRCDWLHFTMVSAITNSQKRVIYVSKNVFLDHDSQKFLGHTK